MKKSSFLSIISLSVTLLLLVICAFGWFANNDEAKVNNGVVQTHGDDDFVFVLEYYDGDSWEVVTNFEFADMMPGDAISFRLSVVCQSTTTTTISAHFTGISSSIHSLVVEDSLIKYNDIALYSIVNNSVTVGEDTLYTISNNEIALADYEIEDAMKVYYIEKKLISETGAADYVPTINESNQNAITADFINSVDVSASSYIYFMLRYEDLENNNYYAYQKLNIDKLAIDY